MTTQFLVGYATGIATVTLIWVAALAVSWDTE